MKKEPHFSERYVPENELVFDTFEDAMAVLKATTHNEPDRTGDYCVLVSREENLYVLNFLYAQNCDRNDVVFMSRDVFDGYYYNKLHDEENEDDL